MPAVVSYRIGSECGGPLLSSVVSWPEYIKSLILSNGAVYVFGKAIIYVRCVCSTSAVR